MWCDGRRRLGRQRGGVSAPERTLRLTNPGADVGARSLAESKLARLESFDEMRTSPHSIVGLPGLFAWTLLVPPPSYAKSADQALFWPSSSLFTTHQRASGSGLDCTNARRPVLCRTRLFRMANLAQTGWQAGHLRDLLLPPSSPTDKRATGQPRKKKLDNLSVHTTPPLWKSTLSW